MPIKYLDKTSQYATKLSVPDIHPIAENSVSATLYICVREGVRSYF